MRSGRPCITYSTLPEVPSWIEGMEPLRIDITRGRDSSGDPEAFNIVVKNVDEFTTKEDWDRVWTNHVKPRQKILWGKRGMSPQGRRTIDISRLARALQLYQKMVTEGLKFKDLIRYPIEDLSKEDWDQEAIRQTITDLEKLLNPESKQSTD